MLALIRLDGNNFDLFGYQGRLRTRVCWSRLPFSRFTCTETLHGVRLDGSVAFYYGQRLFVIAREHLRGPAIRTFLVSWYSSPLKGDPSWITGFAGPTNIWEATIDLSRVRGHSQPRAYGLLNGRR